MELYIYRPPEEGTFPHHRPEVVDTFSSLRWRRRYFDSGEGELHVVPTTKNLRIFQPGGIVQRLGYDEAMIIAGRTVAENDMTITGPFFASQLDQKVIDNYLFSGDAAEGMRQAALQKGIGPYSSYTSGQKINVQTRFRTCGQVVRAIGRAYNLGYRVRTTGYPYDEGEAKIEVYAGVYRGLEATSGVEFSAEIGNLNNMVYNENYLNNKSVAVVAGAGEGDERKILRVTQAAPSLWLEGREIYVDARDIQRTEGQTEAQYEALLEQRGIERLADYQPVLSLDGTVQDVGIYQYQRDWDLGDVVIAKIEKWGICADMRITEVEEVVEGSSYKVYPVLGNPLPEKLEFEGGY